jgi:hypothetical protein
MAATTTCSACGRPLKTGFMVKGKMVTTPSCRAVLCKKFGRPS